jgi:DNA-binding response OmpR family regulator
VPRLVFTDGLTFDPAGGEVCRGGEVHRLEPQPAALLALLASRPGELVTHDEIVRHLWPSGTHVAYREACTTPSARSGWRAATVPEAGG